MIAPNLADALEGSSATLRDITEFSPKFEIATNDSAKAIANTNAPIVAAGRLLASTITMTNPLSL